MFIAIDPGMNVGVATFSPTGTDINKKVFRYDDEKTGFRPFLGLLLESSKNNPDAHLTFIIEDFKLRMDMAFEQTGSDMPASKAIGAVQMIDTLMADRSSIHMVHPKDLNGALKWAGYPKYANNRKLHPPDDIAAYAHGVKFLIDKGLRRHPVLDL